MTICSGSDSLLCLKYLLVIDPVQRGSVFGSTKLKKLLVWFFLLLFSNIACIVTTKEHAKRPPTRLWQAHLTSAICQKSSQFRNVIDKVGHIEDVNNP